MIEKIKKIFSCLFKNKKVFFVFLFFVLFALSLPLKPASAAWYDFLVGAITYLPVVGISVALFFIASLAALCSLAASLTLTTVIQPWFISMSYTNPANNPVIQVGLGVTQGFVNILLVLILVYIALVTILRLSGYETKKLLSTFVLVALLVNFAPVICGLIVDASNIVMYFFLKNVTGCQQIVNSLANIKDAFFAAAGSMLTLKFTGQMDKVGNLLAITFLNFGLALFLYIFSFLYIARYIAIWILVILSPLAFACYILPNTKKWAEGWWRQFIQWSLIGIPCAFFLYLAEYFASLGSGVFGGIEQGLASTFLPHLVPIAFLALGLIFGLQTSAIGASMVMDYSKKGGKIAGKLAWKGGKWATKKTWKAARTTAESRLPIKENVQKAVSKIEKAPIARWFLPEAVKKYGQFYPDVEKAQAEAKPYSSPDNMERVMKGAKVGAEATGNILETIARGDSQDIFGAAKEVLGLKSDEEVLKDKKFRKIMDRPLEIAKRSGKLPSLVRSDPRLARLLAGKKWAGAGYENINEEAAVQKAVSEARSQHISNWEPEVLSDSFVMEAALGQFDRERWLQVNRTIKRGQPEAHKGINKVFTEFIDQKNLHPTTKKDEEDIWDKDFKDYIKAKNQGREGYFKALEDKRVRDTGWEKGRYTPGLSPGASPSTPGQAAGMGEEPPEELEPEEEELRREEEELERELKEEEEKLKREEKRSAPRKPEAPKRDPEIYSVVRNVPLPDVGKPEAPKKAPATEKASVPLMITRKMKKELREKGYSNEEIRQMTPEEAWKNLGRSF